MRLFSISSMYKKYTSIENTYRTEFLERIKGHGFWDDEYVVQEKVHGANLSFWTTDGETFSAAKRMEPLAPDEKFYNHQSILEAMKPGLQHIYAALKAETSDLKQLTIFGEVIGGDYPHPEVEPDKNAIMVQKGIFYSPNNHFYAFDLMVNTETYLDVDVANHHFEQQNLLYAKTLYRGGIEACLDYPNNFNTVLPGCPWSPQTDSQYGRRRRDQAGQDQAF